MSESSEDLPNKIEQVDLYNLLSENSSENTIRNDDSLLGQF